MKKNSNCILFAIINLIMIIKIWSKDIESNIKFIDDSLEKTNINNYTKDEIENNPNVQINPSEVRSHASKACNYRNCPPNQGVCYEGECICAYGFTTLDIEEEPLKYCNYKQKSRMTAFFLEFFFPIGLGHIYAAKYLLALIKFSLFFLFFCGVCGEICCMNLNMDKLMFCSAFTLLADMCFWLTFQLVDLICYAFGFYKDGNGVPML